MNRYWLRDSIGIALYGMAWSKSEPTLRNVIKRVKFLYNILNDAGIVEDRL